MNSNLMVSYNILFDQQYEVGIIVNNTQKNFSQHTHDYLEIACQLKGDIKHIINGELYIIPEHSLVVIGTDNTHENIKSDSLSLVISISEKYLNNIVIESAFDLAIINLKNYLLGTTPIIYEMTPTMISIVQKLYENTTDECNAYYIKQRMLITQFILEFEYHANISTSNKSVQDDLITYLFENIQTASLTEYAQKLHYSPITVGAKIKREYGMNFSQILKQIRLKMAADLLINTSITIEQIMFEIGYNNKTYFYSNFKELYSVSPGTYRKKMNKDII